MQQEAQFYADAPNEQAAQLQGLQWAKEYNAIWHNGPVFGYKATAELSEHVDRRDADYDREAEDQQRIADAREGFDNE
jgi:hypothetical protein